MVEAAFEIHLQSQQLSLQGSILQTLLQGMATAANYTTPASPVASSINLRV
jgi:hypothetical protein